MQSSSFLGAVDKAITKVTQQQPSLFDFNLKTCENCYLVKDQSAFVAARDQEPEQRRILFDVRR